MHADWVSLVLAPVALMGWLLGFWWLWHHPADSVGAWARQATRGPRRALFVRAAMRPALLSAAVTLAGGLIACGALGRSVGPAVAGAALAGLAAWVGTAVSGHAARAVIGAVCAGALCALAVADLTEDGVGAWWADRPMAVAFVAGVLVLVVTVVLIDAVVARQQELRFRSAVRLVSTGIAESTSRTVASAKLNLSRLEGVDRLDLSADALGAIRELQALASAWRHELDADVGLGASVFLGGGALGLYERALDLRRSVAVFEGAVRALDELAAGLKLGYAVRPATTLKAPRQTLATCEDALRAFKQVASEIVAQPETAAAAHRR